jgi:hypothetical protein
VFGPKRIEQNDVPPFFSFKRFIVKDDDTNQYGIFRLEPGDDHVIKMDKEIIGQALLIRKPDFEHK